MPRRRLSPRRLTRWLRGRSTLAGLLGLADLDRDDLAWRADRLVKAKSYNDALRLYDLLGLLWPENAASALLGRGVCLQRAGALDRAERAYDGALEARPDDPYALANRAEVRLLTGRVAAARDDLARALAALDRLDEPESLRRRVEALRERAQSS